MHHDELKHKIESAFHPYQCVVEIKPYGVSFGFRVYDLNDKTILTVEN